MSGYVRNIEIKVPFDGQDVRLVLKPLQRGDLFKLQGMLSKSGLRAGMTPEQIAAVDPAGSAEAFEFYAGRLSSYVQESNVLDAAGSSVPIEEWCACSYFVQLVSEVMVQHMAKAVPSSPLPSAGPPAGSSS